MPFRRIHLVLAAVCLVAGGCGSSRAAWSPSVEPIDGPSSVVPWRRPVPNEAARAAYDEARRMQGLGRRADAVARALDAVEADAAFLEAHRLLQDLTVRTTADWWAKQRYERMYAEQRADANAPYYLARLESDPERQLELFEAALALDPSHPYATLGRAMVLARAGRVGEALAATRRSAELAPWLQLPWLWLGNESLKRGEPEAAARFFGAARDRASDDPRAWLGLAQADDELKDTQNASRCALEALRLAPGDEGIAPACVELLTRAGVPGDIASARDVLARARSDGARPSACVALTGRLLDAEGCPEEAVATLTSAVSLGAGTAEVHRPLCRARVRAGRYREAVAGALAALPLDAFAKDNLYAPRWERLRAASEVPLADARALLELAEAMASVGWLEESRTVLVAARAAAPDDPVVAARAASEAAFATFVEELGTIGAGARDAARGGTAQTTVEELLDRVSATSLRCLGRDATQGAVVRSYPFLGSFALSAASSGAFETTFGSHGIAVLVGARASASAELVLGRIVVLRAGAGDEVAGTKVAFDECWVESEGLPPEAAGLRRGLAGLTLDRFVTLQLDTIRHDPAPPESGLPFELRPAPTREARRSLDTPSDVAGRIEAKLAAAGDIDEAALDAVRRHELVHVLDASRLLPVTAHPFAALAFVVSHGFDSASGERALEAHAQVASITESREPRLALAALLGFLPSREGETAHASAYREAAQAAVDIVIDDPAAFPSIDRTYNVLQQMDALTDAEVRELGRRLAERF
jgi:tetratricopeptide (TPR) repeat protein